MVEVQFQQVKLTLLRYYLIYVRGEFGVGLDDLCADGTLDGGFDFGLCAGGEAAEMVSADGFWSAGG